MNAAVRIAVEGIIVLPRRQATLSSPETVTESTVVPRSLGNDRDFQRKPGRYVGYRLTISRSPEMVSAFTPQTSPSTS